MEQEIFFDVDSYLDEKGNVKIETGGSSVYRIQREFIDKVIKKAKELHADTIISNGNLANAIGDYANNYAALYSLGKLYTIGSISGITIMVDPYMRWTDNYLHFEINDKKILRKVKLKTINGTLTEKDKYGRVYSGYVKDTKGILI